MSFEQGFVSWTTLICCSSQSYTKVGYLLLFLFSVGLGLLVFLDIVHSYAAADEMVGLSLFDGSNDCYFHTGKLCLEINLSMLSCWFNIDLIGEELNETNTIFFVVQLCIFLLLNYSHSMSELCMSAMFLK